MSLSDKHALVHMLPRLAHHHSLPSALPFGKYWLVQAASGRICRFLYCLPQAPGPSPILPSIYVQRERELLLLFRHHLNVHLLARRLESSK